MGTCNSSKSPRKRDTFEDPQPPSSATVVGLAKSFKVRERWGHFCNKWSKKRKIWSGIFLKGCYVQFVWTYVPLHMQVRALQISCVCERQWGIVSNRERVYCSQMWTGMWRVGMQWLLKLSRPSFIPLLLPFVPISCVYQKTPLYPHRLLYTTKLGLSVTWFEASD